MVLCSLLMVINTRSDVLVCSPTGAQQLLIVCVCVCVCTCAHVVCWYVRFLSSLLFTCIALCSLHSVVTPVKTTHTMHLNGGLITSHQ